MKIIITLSVLFFTIQNTITAQIIDNNLYYSCKDCKISTIKHFGENKILLYHDGGAKKDLIYLLDSNNLFIDTLEVTSANGIIMKLSNNEFIATDLNIPTQVKIINNKLEVSAKRIFTTYHVKDFYNGCNIILDGKYMLGRIHHINVNKQKVYDMGLTCTNISKATLNEIPKFLKIQYGFILSEKYYMFDYKNNIWKKLNNDLKTDTIIPYKLTLEKRSNCTSVSNYDIESFSGNYYGFYSYSFNNKYIYYFDLQSQSLFTIGRDSLDLVKYFRLPITNIDKNAWKHYYDEENSKHYFLQMVKSENDSLQNRKDIIKNTTFSFDLFEYNEVNNDLTYRCSINYVPNSIYNENLFRIKNNGERTDILRIPITNIITNSNVKLKITNIINVE